jgi:hypothetical protein
MANVTHEDLTTWKVEGSVCTVYVNVSLDDVVGALYHVWDEEGERRLHVNGDKDAALEWADNFADKGEPCDEDGEERPVEEEAWDGFNSDAEADADALASAGMGTDEDYGCFDSGDH